MASTAVAGVFLTAQSGQASGVAWWQALLIALAGVAVVHLLTRLQVRADRRAVLLAHWAEIGALALARVHLFLAQASPAVVGALVVENQEDTATNELERLAFLRTSYLEPLLQLVHGHPVPEVQ